MKGWKPFTKKELAAIRKSGAILSTALHRVVEAVRPGVSASALNELAERTIVKHGATSSFKGFQDFPAALCVSINDEVVHGLPRPDKIIRDGDIVGLDLGVAYQGWYTDMATTIAVGKIPATAKRLLKVTRSALGIALGVVRDGSTVGDLGQAVQTFVEQQGFSVVRDLVGHGLGRAVHEDPRIPNFGLSGTGAVLKRGMLLAIEPMVTERDFAITTDDDGWTVRTRDGGLAAHEERTILVTVDGYEVITPWDAYSA